MSLGSFWLRLAFRVGRLGLRLRPSREMRLLQAKGGTFMPTPYSSLSAVGSGLGTKAAEAWHTCPGPQAVGNITDSLKHTSSVQVYEGITDLVVHAVDGQHHYSGVHVCTALLLWTLPMEALTQRWAVCVCCVAVEGRFLHSSVNCSLTCSFIAFPQPLPLTDTHFVSRTLFSQRVHFCPV